jgi:glycosyltransferase involved in cell wall biosynthesis
MKISVITINYNDKIGLQKTFNSVFKQTFKDFEYIVIDGNSSDGSKELIETNQEKINYWISEKDTGVYNALNKGIKAATGEYLIFMNSGDIFYDDQVLENVFPLINENFDFYYGDALFVKENFEELHQFPSELSFYFFSHNGICHQSSIIKRTLFEDSFYYNESLKIVSDWEFLLYNLCINNICYKHLAITICKYDLNGISSTCTDLKNQEREIVMNQYFPMFKEDYKEMLKMNILKSKRILNVLHIKKYPIAWKILKGFISIQLLFLPKKS